jgi:hypothetical protein
MPFKFLHILVTSKIILASKYEIATLGVDHVKMSEQCSAAIANGLEKQKDFGCPTIPCSVGSFKFGKALCDLGASVSGHAERCVREATPMIGAYVYVLGVG